VTIERHDVIAIGCGPFNLGLAALASTISDLDLVVLEARGELRWHPGMMVDGATLQVNFLADLVSLVDPTHPLSFLNCLRDTDRLYPFYVRERFHPTRREYESYLRWAAARLPSVRFSHRVEQVRWHAGSGLFLVDVLRGDGAWVRMAARDLVVGIGTAPFVPPALAGLPPDRCLHTADYLHRKSDVDRVDRVTVVGSGQSGAEVVLDLLRDAAHGGPTVSWLTRTASFAPLDYSKLVLEMTTPDYVRYFHSLPAPVRDGLVAEQWRHYKGISTQTLDDIHDALYQRDLEGRCTGVEFRCGVEVLTAAADTNDRISMTCRHRDTGRTFVHVTDTVIAATGYRPREPAFLAGMTPAPRRDEQGRFVVRLDHSAELADGVTGRIFVPNADLHSHGVAAPDLGVGAFRNATILNAVTGREVYPLPKRTAYTSFGAPGDLS